MIFKIVFSLISFLLFTYTFIFKLIKKNDTTYLVILIGQAIGILLNFMQLLFNVFTGGFWNVIIWLLCIIIPAIVLIIESRGLNFSELLYICISKILLLLGNKKKAKDILNILVSKYDKSYNGHKILAEVYEKEGGMRKSIDEYVKVLDIKGDDYKSYFKISKLLNDLEKKDEAIEMLKILVNKKPELYEPSKMLGELLIDKEKFKEAINMYIKSIKYNPDKAELYYDLGIAYCRMNEFSLAKQCFEKTIEIDSNIYNAYYRLGQISLLYRDIEAAEGYFLQSMYEETELKSYYQLAKINMIKNNKNKAAIFLNKSIDLDPSYYDIIINEPIFLSIKELISKPEDNKEPSKIIESEKEKAISAYLDNTYLLTRVLNEKDNKNSNDNN